jgi:hypothetical protein
VLEKGTLWIIKILNITIMKSFLTAMEQQVFCIFIDYRGHHIKGVEFTMSLKSIYDKKPLSLNKKMYF